MVLMGTHLIRGLGWLDTVSRFVGLAALDRDCWKKVTCRGRSVRRMGRQCGYVDGWVWLGWGGGAGLEVWEQRGWAVWSEVSRCSIATRYGYHHGEWYFEEGSRVGLWAGVLINTCGWGLLAGWIEETLVAGGSHASEMTGRWALVIPNCGMPVTRRICCCGAVFDWGVWGGWLKVLVCLLWNGSSSWSKLRKKFACGSGGVQDLNHKKGGAMRLSWMDERNGGGRWTELVERFVGNGQRYVTNWALGGARCGLRERLFGRERV
ncbi:hypothetical protein Tco_0624576 [Tanacetum coccineum]|uniref:Uncharacterized protein n=1 Tax=Tanacetum coccineum TaxID=301880 RepID=A0ABQ4WEC9_9ASTR